MPIRIVRSISAISCKSSTRNSNSDGVGYSCNCKEVTILGHSIFIALHHIKWCKPHVVMVKLRYQASIDFVGDLAVERSSCKGGENKPVRCWVLYSDTCER